MRLKFKKDIHDGEDVMQRVLDVIYRWGWIEDGDKVNTDFVVEIKKCKKRIDEL